MGNAFNEYKRGDVIIANFPIYDEKLNRKFHVQKKARPAIILQNNIGNLYSTTLIVAKITSVIKKDTQPTHVVINVPFLEKESMILFEQIETIDKYDVIAKKGTIEEPYILTKIEEAVCASLDIKRNDKKPLIVEKNIEAPIEPKKHLTIKEKAYMLYDEGSTIENALKTLKIKRHQATLLKREWEKDNGLESEIEEHDNLKIKDVKHNGLNLKKLPLEIRNEINSFKIYVDLFLGLKEAEVREKYKLTASAASNYVYRAKINTSGVVAKAKDYINTNKERLIDKHVIILNNEEVEDTAQEVKELVAVVEKNIQNETFETEIDTLEQTSALIHPAFVPSKNDIHQKVIHVEVVRPQLLETLKRVLKGETAHFIIDEDVHIIKGENELILDKASLKQFKDEIEELYNILCNQEIDQCFSRKVII